jgi:AraC family transcriptional regulator, transcriptional activator of pobA
MQTNTSGIGVKNKIEQQLFKISPFKEVIERTKPRKHDAYFELIYLSEGAGQLLIRANDETKPQRDVVAY